MTRRTATLWLGAAAVLTLALLLLISLALQRTSGRSATPTPTQISQAATDTDSVSNADAEGGAPTPEATVSGGADAGPSDLPYSQTQAARRQWEPIVVGFGTQFTRTTGGSATAWRQGLDRYVTTAVQKQLRTVDPRNVPSGRYTSFEVDTYEEHTVAAMVTYEEGWALVLYLIDDGERWRIYRYDRWEE